MIAPAQPAHGGFGAVLWTEMWIENVSLFWSGGVLICVLTPWARAVAGRTPGRIRSAESGAERVP